MTEDSLKEDIETLGMDIDSIRHVILLGGIEFIGELIDSDEDDDLYFMNPVRIIKDVFLDPEGDYNCNNIFVEWNPCISEPFIPINRALIISKVRPNEISLKNYVMIVKQLYFEVENDETETGIDTDTSDRKISTLGNNVIDFLKWKPTKK